MENGSHHCDTTDMVVPVPVLVDNYSYIVLDRVNHQCLVVDPAEPDKVVNTTKCLGVPIKLVLCTHKHFDHSGGNERIYVMLGGTAEVVGSGYERTPGITKPVKHLDTLQLGTLKITCLHTPCHTTGHLTYKIEAANNTSPPLLFTGDTLFIGGCGRFFEGSAEEMRHSLLDIIGNQPKDSLVYCGHEYTVANLRFALSVDPTNGVLQTKHKWAIEMREQNRPTVPSRLLEEFTYNPFMRLTELAIQQATGRKDPIEVMQILRDMKNNFGG